MKALGRSFIVLVLLGCGSAVEPHATSLEGDSTSNTTADDPGFATSSTSSSTSSGDSPTTTDGDSTGMVFVPGPDGGVSFECDLFAQDCSRGEKCTPWISEDDRGTKCVPVVDEPAVVDEPCHMEGSPYSGIDDCDFGSMCFYVDPDTLEGICTPFCAGDEASPQCDPDRFCSLSADSPLILCLPRCNPLLQDCASGQACYEIANEWGCGPDVSGEAGAYGDPCDAIADCDPGLVCLDSIAVPPGQPCEGSPGCCTELCDLADPLGDMQCTGAAEGMMCQSWYGDDPEPGYEDVGVCALPQ